jgi:hypothetical protein
VSFPALYGSWIEELLGAPVDEEPRSTCSDCPLCSPDQTIPAAQFHPDARCCTNIPEIPNFLVGATLRDPNPALETGRKSLLERLHRQGAATPLGLGRAPSDNLRYAEAGNYMGKRVDLVCPHYVTETSTCGIWPHRNAVCSTWFCRHERGAVGYASWSAIKELLLVIERELALWCAVELELGPLAMRTLLGRPRDPKDRQLVLEGAQWEAAWGPWLHRQEAYFIECAERVAELSWTDILNLTSAEVRARAEYLRLHHVQSGTPGVPDTLVVGQHQVLAIGAEAKLLSTYSPYDPIAIPTVLSSVLHYFDGRPTTEALQAIADERGVSIQGDLLQQLMDWGVLVQA